MTNLQNLKLILSVALNFIPCETMYRLCLEFLILMSFNFQPLKIVFSAKRKYNSVIHINYYSRFIYTTTSYDFTVKKTCLCVFMDTLIKIIDSDYKNN